MKKHSPPDDVFDESQEAQIRAAKRSMEDDDVVMCFRSRTSCIPKKEEMPSTEELSPTRDAEDLGPPPAQAARKHRIVESPRGSISQEMSSPSVTSPVDDRRQVAKSDPYQREFSMDDGDIVPEVDTSTFQSYLSRHPF